MTWQVVALAKVEPLKVMISGPPASGKGTQCELITKKVSFFFIFNLLLWLFYVFIFFPIDIYLI